VNSSRWHWVSDGLLPLAVALLRVCPVWPWLQLFRRWLAPLQRDPVLALPLMLGLVLGGMAAARAAAARDKSLRLARLLVAAGGLALMLLVCWWQFYRAEHRVWSPEWVAALLASLTHWGTELPAPIITLGATACLWLRGLLDGRRPLNSDDAWGAFVSGFVILALSAAASDLDGRGVPAGTWSLVLLFFGAAMLALAASGLLRAKGVEGRQEAALFGASRYWLVNTTVLIVALLALGVALSALVEPEAIAQALRWTSSALDIVGRALYLVLLVVSYLIFLVLEPLINALRALLRPGELAESVQLPDFREQLEELAESTARSPVAIGEWFRWAGLAAVLLGIGLIFALALRRFWQGRDEEVEETRETVFSSALVLDQMSALWRKWLQRLRRKAVARSDPYLSLEGEVATRRAIRAIYQMLLAAAAQRGWPRLRSQTPAEYQRSLEEELPGTWDVLSTVTGGYLEARYAPEAPAEEVVERVRQAWERIEPALTEPGSH
jgi:hypothetical protein